MNCTSCLEWITSSYAPASLCNTCVCGRGEERSSNLLYSFDKLYVGALPDAVEMYRLCVFIGCLYQQCEGGVGDDRNE